MQVASERPPHRQSVDLTDYPDLVVVYLGFQVSTWRGLKAVFGFTRAFTAMERDRPDGLLAHESVFYGINHVGTRQYWRDLESLESFTRSEPHKTWWREFGADARGTGFWHEAYRRRGGMEAIYLNMPAPIGLARFAAARTPVGPFMSTRQRLVA